MTIGDDTFLIIELRVLAETRLVPQPLTHGWTQLDPDAGSNPTPTLCFSLAMRISLCIHTQLQLAYQQYDIESPGLCAIRKRHMRLSGFALRGAAH
jgi:hypothetical protein